MTLADKIVVLLDGLIMQVRSPRRLYDRPDKLFGAEFIGSTKMNVLSRATEGATFQLPGHGAGAFGGGDVATQFGIRPEHIAVVDADQGHCTGKIKVAEYLTADTFSYVDSAGLRTLIVRTDGSEGDRRGQVVGLRIDDPKTYLFDDEERTIR
ncbi:MAG: ABC transporter ATP-binding protein [Rhodospirillales bacterium]|nr:MAG: ABC transporter ATP-binding protein [Rhodospirillales bacterium]